MMNTMPGKSNLAKKEMIKILAQSKYTWKRGDLKKQTDKDKKEKS